MSAGTCSRERPILAQDASHSPARDSDLAPLQLVPADRGSLTTLNSQPEILNNPDSHESFTGPLVCRSDSASPARIFTQRLLAVSLVLRRLREDLVAWSQDVLLDQTLFDFAASQAVGVRPRLHRSDDSIVIVAVMGTAAQMGHSPAGCRRWAALSFVGFFQQGSHCYRYCPYCHG